MPRAFGDESAKMQAHVLADEIRGFCPDIAFLRVTRVEGVHARQPLAELPETQGDLPGKFLFQGGVEIFAFMSQGGEP